MADKGGFFDGLKDGAIFGTSIGFTVAAVHSFLFGRETDLQQHAEKVKAHRALASSASAVAKPAPPPTLSAWTIRSNVFRRVLGTTATFAGFGAVYMGTEALLRTKRDEDDIWNRLLAAAFAGSFVGVRKGSFFVSAGGAAAMAGGVAFNHVFHGLGPYDKDFSKKRLRLIYRE